MNSSDYIINNLTNKYKLLSKLCFLDSKSINCNHFYDN